METAYDTFPRRGIELVPLHAADFRARLARTKVVWAVDVMTGIPVGPLLGYRLCLRVLEDDLEARKELSGCDGVAADAALTSIRRSECLGVLLDLAGGDVEELIRQILMLKGAECFTD